MWGSSCGVWKRRFSGYGPWEAAESCVVGTSASTYRRLQESPEQPRGAALSSWGPPPRAALSSSRPPASEHLPRCESEDSGVEMPSNEPSPLTPLGTHGSFSLPRKPPPVGGPGTDPPRPQHSRSASKKLAQAAQRSRRQRAPGRCPRQLGRHSGGAASLWAQLARESREQEEPKVENPDGEPTQPPGWRGQRFRPRSCSDSQTPGRALGQGEAAAHSPRTPLAAGGALQVGAGGTFPRPLPTPFPPLGWMKNAAPVTSHPTR
ncbi:uncharacterized protein C8orf58 homolog isoform X6 [Pogoniulus pusillus]|uniref:uncharacterized protein C8orf58 homolog isoform X6 n=1 Tax=Pogoniulus pusillus TaxID=488313 RepID=UPI0030B97D34